MLVKQRLRIISVVSASSVLVILVVLLLTIFRINKALEASNISDAIISASFERLILRTDLHRTGSERSKVQLIAKHAQIGDLLKVALEKFSAPEDIKTINELLAVHESIGKISKTIRENQEKRRVRTRPDILALDIENRLLSQLNMRVYETILLDYKLQESSKKAVISVLRLGGGGILFVLLLVSATILINSWMMARRISDRISKLHNGSCLIGGGNLDHRIDIKGDDELAELSEAFNDMTVKLSDSYHKLEKEIEERTQAEKRLHLQAKMLDSVGQAVIATDINQTVLYWNKTAARMFGWTSEEVLGRSLVEILAPQVSPEMQTEVTAILARSEAWSGEFVVLSKDKRTIPLFTTNSPLIDEQGRIIAIIGIGADITDRKRSERLILDQIEKLHASNEELSRFNIASLGRELRMIELKKEINVLCEQTGQDPRYPLDFEKEPA
jgi:PAS domain S-box-containing protein